jgi:PAS domain S-box-containing protein
MHEDAESWSIHPTAAQLLGVLDTLNAGIVARTEGGDVIFANDRMLHWLGYTLQELDGMNIRSLLPSELLPSLDEELDEIHSGDERLRIAVLKRKDGRTFPIIFCPHVIREDDAIIAVVTVVMDLGEVQTAKRPAPGVGGDLAAHLERIANELHTISLFAGAQGVAGIPYDHPEIEQLSPREREILGQLVAGSRVPAIARQLFISPHTVRNHLKSIYRKLEVSDQAELIERVRALGRRS